MPYPYPHSVVAITPCSDLAVSQAFYERLGFVLQADYPTHGYKIMADPKGANLHLNRAQLGRGFSRRNPFGLYFYAENVEALAASLGLAAEDKPWGLREFSISDPDGTLVRIGWGSEHFAR